MAHPRQSHASSGQGPAIKAVLGPTNTGKTHLAIERLCAHSSGAIGFPLRLLAREVYDRVRAIKGDAEVALITGEERIEPPGARWFLCTAEAMPVISGPEAPAFIALDEAQLAADRERGHIFTDRFLHARGREETMLLGSATLEPMVRALVPKAEISERPRFSTLSHIGPRKLSRLPPRSAIVAFSVEQVYAMAEALRRHRGGAAVVMGALSPETRNRQVELFQSGEVDYIVATDAIGMGLNLDVGHVAFAGLSKFDGVRQRRLTPAEMAQIAGRAGRHHKDGTFSTLSGGHANAFTEDEVFAIEEHRFAPLTHLYWRNPEPRFDTVERLIADLAMKPHEPELRAAPEAIDLAVLRKLAEAPAAGALRGPGDVRRFWEACQLPDFRQLGADQHARFVARLWQDLRGGYIGADFVAARIAELDRTQGDIDTLQGRIAAIRSWAYICQRPDWVLARDEMAARARAVEAKLSDALHARLTERFVNRRTSVLMKAIGKDPALLAVELSETGVVLVEGQEIGQLDGFRFVVDRNAKAEDRKLLLAAAERHLPRLLALKAEKLVSEELGDLELQAGEIRRGGQPIAVLEQGRLRSAPRLVLAKELGALDGARREQLAQALQLWLDKQLESLAPLRKLEEAAESEETGSEARALLLTLIARNGTVRREDAGLANLPADRRRVLRKMGVHIGALDIFVPALLKPAPRALLHLLGLDTRSLNPGMESVIALDGKAPAGYRPCGKQAVRIDIAEKILRAAHDSRSRTKARKFAVDHALGISTGLTEASLVRLLSQGGFKALPRIELAERAFGPPAPHLYQWRPIHKDRKAAPAGRQQGKQGQKRGQKRGPREKGGRQPSAHGPAKGSGAFDALADLLR